MGYTHYYYLPAEIKRDTFNAIATDIQTIAEASGVELAGEWDDATGGPGGDPVFGTCDLVLLNGVGKNGHETFYFARRWFPAYPDQKPHKDDEGRIFHFCKTAMKFYDIVVTAALIVMKHHLEDAVHISSDGEDGDWQPGRSLVHSALGYGTDYAIQGEGEERGLYRTEVAV